MEDGRKVLVVYSGEVSYIGEVEGSVDSLDNIGNAGLIIYNPMVMNIRPVQNDEKKLEAVVVDMMLPIEYGGIAISEQTYTGFVNFLQTMVEIPGQASGYITTPSGGKLSVNKLKSLADRSDPAIRLFSVQKTFNPSPELLNIYRIKMAGYKDLLYGVRLVDLQAIQDDEPEKETNRNQGNVIDMEKFEPSNSIN